MSAARTFVTAPRILTGAGCFGELGKEARALGERALVVCGRRALRASGRLDQALALLRDAGAQAFVFDEVEPEPTLATVDAARAACRKNACDVVVGIGGGSALDVAKAAASLARSDLPTREHFAGAEVPAAGLPIVAAPTTAGTGSEVTVNSVLRDPDSVQKKSIRGPALLPRAAIVDPELLQGLPPRQMACSGLDALTQAIESYTSIHATPLTDGLALQAFRCLSRGLPRVLDGDAGPAALSDMANGSLMAGMALANARLGVVHGIAHPLGVRAGLPHGLVCGALLPHAIRFNQAAAAEKYEQLSHICGAALLEFAESLLEKAGLSDALREASVPTEAIPLIAEESLPSGSLKANPRPVTKDDVVRLLEEALM